MGAKVPNMPGLISQANLTVRITVKNATPLEMEKYGRIDFAPSKRSDIGQNTTKSMGTHAELLRSTLSFSELFYIRTQHRPWHVYQSNLFFFGQYPIGYWVKKRFSYILPCPGGSPNIYMRISAYPHTLFFYAVSCGYAHINLHKPQQHMHI